MEANTPSELNERGSHFTDPSYVISVKNNRLLLLGMWKMSVVITSSSPRLSHKVHHPLVHSLCAVSVFVFQQRRKNTATSSYFALHLKMFVNMTLHYYLQLCELSQASLFKKKKPFDCVFVAFNGACLFFNWLVVTVLNSCLKPIAYARSNLMESCTDTRRPTFFRWTVLEILWTFEKKRNVQKLTFTVSRDLIWVKIVGMCRCTLQFTATFDKYS